MAVLRTFIQRTSNTNNRNQNTQTDSSSDTSSSTTTTERVINPTNDGYSSTSTLGVLTVHSDDSIRPLLHSNSTNRRRTFFSRLIHHHQQPSIPMTSQQEEQNQENLCLFDKKLPKELILRIFSYLDYKSLCRCAQVSKVITQETKKPKLIMHDVCLVLEYACI